MKKFLSLVLALVMTMSLVTVSAGAKDFTDSTKIQYTEAVDVMSAVKVIDGYADGSFNPSATLTRGAAAKIICNLILGPTTASALVADAAPYKDVPTNHTFAGYIAYCQKTGIISGYADGTFKPANTLTGYAFMKMLLGALGYDADVEGYTGPNWSINVAKRALNIGLADDLVGNFNGVKAVTREEACLYALNTLTADMVEYDSTTNITVGGAQVVIAGSKAKEMENKGTTDGKVFGKDGVMQFAEKYFTDLTVRKDEDDFGRPANMWKMKAEEIGTYANTADATYTKKVEAGDIYKDLGLGSTIAAKDVTVYVNGAEKTAAEIDIKKGSETKIGKAVNSDGNGVLTEVFYDDDADTITITQILTYIGEINKTTAATSKKDAYVDVVTTVDAAGNKPDGASGVEKFETDEKFEDEAKVLYTFTERNGGEIKSVELAQEINGTVTQVKNKTNDLDNSGLTMAGTEYKASKTIASGLLGAISVDQDYTAYVDAYGYVISVSEEDYKDYALVLELEGESMPGTFNTNRAKLLFTDGSTATVSLAKDYYSKGIAQWEIVTYKADNGVYTLKEVKKTQKAVDVNAFVLENGKALISTDTADTNSAATVYGNSKTMFVVKNVTDKDYTAYTGVKNAPTVKSAAISGGEVSAYWYCKSGDIVTAMFILPEDDAQVTDENNNLLFLSKGSVSDLIHNSLGDYYEYQAVVNGEVKTVKVDWKVKLNGTAQTVAKSAELNGLFSKYNMDKDGIITSVTTYATTGTGKIAGYGVGSDRNSADYTVLVKNGTDTVITTAKNTGTWTVDDSAKFYEIDKDGNVSVGAYGSVTKDDNDRLYFVLDDGQIVYMFVEEVEDVEAVKTHGVKFVGYENTFYVNGTDGVNMVSATKDTVAVAEGADLKFKPVAAQAGEMLKSVKVNGVALTPDADGYYTISNVTKDVTVTLEKTAAVTLTFSISNALVKLNGETVKNGDAVKVEKDSNAVLTVVFANNSTAQKVEVGGTALPGFGNEYTVPTSANATIAVSATLS